MQEYIINPARVAGRRVNQNWIVHMQKESHIVSKSGAECKWTPPLSQVGAMVHTGAIYVRGASRVVAAEWDLGFSELAIKPKFKMSSIDQVNGSGLGERVVHIVSLSITSPSPQ
jgi:hypothetical protein